jgi:hypothetical protein
MFGGWRIHRDGPRRWETELRALQKLILPDDIRADNMKVVSDEWWVVGK